MTTREILGELDVLRSPVLDLATLTLDGVALGSPVESFPRHKIVEVTLAKIVHSHGSGTGVDPEYFDASGCALTTDEVIDSAFRDDGIVHFTSKLSYKIVGGRVAGFAIYGDQLKYFGKITSHDQLLRSFGTPDRVCRIDAYGDLMGYDNYYYGSRKLVRLDSRFQRVTLINLGGYDGNDGQTPNDGG